MCGISTKLISFNLKYSNFLYQNSCWVSLCCKTTDVPVCAVVGFPLGSSLTDVKAFETNLSISNGASEIDMVINIGFIKSGEYDKAREDIECVARICHQRSPRVVLKVILEMCLLTDVEKDLAARIALRVFHIRCLIIAYNKLTLHQLGRC